MSVEFDAKVKKIAQTLVEPKDGPAYTRTIVTVEVDQVLSPTELAELSRFQRDAATVVAFASRQAGLPLANGAAEDDPAFAEVDGEPEPAQSADDAGVEVGEGADA